MKITGVRIEIDETGNAAFDDGQSGTMEIARILRKLATRFEDGGIPRAVLDTNGNTVGVILVEVEED
ncbi:hypothetical protein VPH49_22105 [Pseudomonas luteola]|uniref:hypothetical protein n=1 Tax=Pseudomonas luteola TaxID=47886 RepID=UPI003A867520